MGQGSRHIIQLARRFASEDWGGTETVILQTCKQLLSRGYQTELMCTLATASKKREQIEGLTVSRFPYFYPYWGLAEKAKRLLDKKGGSPFSFSLLRAMLKAPDLDLVHLHVGNRIGGIGRYVARKRGIPYIISIHGGLFDVPPAEAQTWTAPANKAFEWGKLLGWWVGSRRVYSDAAAIVCVGQREQELVKEKFPDKRVVHIPNGVDLEHFARGDGAVFRAKYGISSDKYVMLTVARIDSQKNQLFLVKALPDILKVQPDAHLVLIGAVTNQQYFAGIEEVIANTGMQDHVTVIPGLEANSQELVDAYHGADLFVLPSVHEPFGIVLLEAWASRLPVIASSTGGIPYFVSHDETGLLFEPNNKDAFVECLDKVINSEYLSKQLSIKGFEQATQYYSWEAVTEQLSRLYEDVINKTQTVEFE